MLTWCAKLQDIILVKIKNRFKSFEVPYNNNSTSLLLLLPDENKSVKDLESQLNANVLNKLLKNMHHVLVQLHLPRFNLNLVWIWLLHLIILVCINVKCLMKIMLIFQEYQSKIISSFLKLFTKLLLKWMKKEQKQPQLLVFVFPQLVAIHHKQFNLLSTTELNSMQTNHLC